MKSKQIFVYIENDKNGGVKRGSLEALCAARMLAKFYNGQVTGILIGADFGIVENNESLSMVDRILIVDGSEYRCYTTQAYTAAMERLVIKYQPAIVLAGATYLSRDLMPRLACRLDAGLIADCTGFFKDERENLIWKSRSLNGITTVEMSIQGDAPQLILTRQGAFETESNRENIKCEIIREDIHMVQSDIKTKLIKVICGSTEKKLDLKTSKVIVSGGRGVGGIDGFCLLKQLASKLGGEVGASRSAVDSGWIAKEHQVGKTGQIVRPRIYIACGISGAIQHLEGMSSSDIIIAINKDANAPIFRVANYGVVGDLHAVIPAFINALGTDKAYSL